MFKSNENYQSVLWLGTSAVLSGTNMYQSQSIDICRHNTCDIQYHFLSGENCRHSDGTIIKKGDVYNPDPNISCMCPTSFHFGPTEAVCAIKAVDPVLHVDPVNLG